jgi:hypothetical protein
VNGTGQFARAPRSHTDEVGRAEVITPDGHSRGDCGLLLIARTGPARHGALLNGRRPAGPSGVTIKTITGQEIIGGNSCAS